MTCLCYCKGDLGLSCLRNSDLFINQGSSPREFLYCTSLNAQSTRNLLPIQDLRSLSRKCSFSLLFWVSRCLLSSAAGGSGQLRSKGIMEQGTGLSSGSPLPCFGLLCLKLLQCEPCYWERCPKSSYSWEGSEASEISQV